MFTIDQHIRSIQANLEKHSDVLTANLQKVLSYRFSPATDLLDFTAFIEPSRHEISIRMFSMDQDGNEVFSDGKDPSIFAGSEEVLQDIEYLQLDNSEREAFSDFYEENDLEIYEQEQQAFADWFSACWKKAGGDALDLPAYFVLHGESNAYDLKNSEWIADDEKWA